MSTAIINLYKFGSWMVRTIKLYAERELGVQTFEAETLPNSSSGLHNRIWACLCLERLTSPILDSKVWNSALI